MYGLPSHDEMDPTIFVALTYTFIFGAMFGDVGQGLCLFIGGGLLYKIKKWNLAGIISIAGIFSTFFGFMFGSFFGFEGTIIKPMWLSPMHAMMKLPFVGQLKYCIYRGSCIWYGTNPACDGISDHQCKETWG